MAMQALRKRQGGQGKPWVEEHRSLDRRKHRCEPMYLPRRAYDLLSEACSFDTSSMRAPQLGRLIFAGVLHRPLGWEVRILWLAVEVVHQHASTVGQVRGGRRRGHLIAQDVAFAYHSGRVLQLVR